MKRLVSFFCLSLSIFAGCSTTGAGQGSGVQAPYSPQYSMVEKRAWISVSQVLLYQDETTLYVSFTYASDLSGKYSVFNPPSGKAFMEKGSLAKGGNTVVRGIDKESLEGIEGITVLFFPGDYSNDSERAGFFVSREEIRLNRIPLKPEGLAVQSAEAESPESSTAVAHNLKASVSSQYEITTDDSHNTELRVSIEGLDEQNLSVYFDRTWTGEKNQSKVVNASPVAQPAPAAYRFMITPAGPKGVIGLTVYSDRNRDSRFTESPVSEEISSFLVDVAPGKGTEYVIRYISASVAIKIEGDLGKYRHPMILTNRRGVGSFPKEAFAISDHIRITTIIPTYYPNYDALSSTCELFDDLNGNGLFDYGAEPVISESITIDLENPDSPANVLTVTD